MDIFNYIDKYGDYSFRDVKFNEIDNVILAVLSYVDFNNIIYNNSKKKISLFDAGDMFLSSDNANDKNIMGVRDAIKILKHIYKKNRYSKIMLYNYINIYDNNEQFCGLCIDILDDLVYVSFEGTDQNVSGWKEDFELAYRFPVMAQRRAINYLNKYFTFNNKHIIVGGHSKGGNLAMVGAMYANYFVRKKIINIYNNDGPGFRDREFNSSKYKNMSEKLIFIIPNYSVVGLLLNHSDNYVVIESKYKSILSHSIVSWIVDDNNFNRTSLSEFSLVFSKGIKSWLDKYNDRELEIFVRSLFDIFRIAKVDSLIQIMENKKLLFDILKESNNLEDNTKKMINDFMIFIFKYFKDYNMTKLEHLFK